MICVFPLLSFFYLNNRKQESSEHVPHAAFLSQHEDIYFFSQKFHYCMLHNFRCCMLGFMFINLRYQCGKINYHQFFLTKVYPIYCNMSLLKCKRAKMWFIPTFLSYKPSQVRIHQYRAGKMMTSLNHINSQHRSIVCAMCLLLYVLKPSANDHRNAFLCSITQLSSVNVAMTGSWSWTCWLVWGLQPFWGVCPMIGRIRGRSERNAC